MTNADIAGGIALFLVYLVGMRAGIGFARRCSPARIAIIGAIATGVSALLLGPFMPWPANLWRTLSCFACLTLVFLMIFGAVFKSVSLRMLIELSRAPGRRMTCDILSQRYLEAESYGARLKVMIAGGLAVEHAGVFELTQNGRRLASAARRVQRVFGIERSG